MASERKQKKRLNSTARTPKKSKAPEKHIIGSSSTWNGDELHQFKVQQGGQADPKLLIPEKWFEFVNLEHYQSGIYVLYILSDS